MKSGCLYIDGIDTYTHFGVYVIQGGWAELIALPPLKAVNSNDWQEEDGLEVDLSAPVLNSREVAMRFAVSGVFNRYNDFIALLADGAVHTFLCAEIGRTFRLRLVSQPNLELARLLGFLTLKFADDYPLDGYTYAAPTGGGLPQLEDYLLDGVRFSDYGVRLLQGTFGEVMKMPDVKTALLRNIPSQAGAIYDTGGEVTFRPKDVKLSCLLRADSLAEFWNNYYALCHDLSQPNPRTLYIRELEQEFECYYKSCSVTDFEPAERIWLQFTLTLAFVGSCRIAADEMLLATEGGVLVFTQDNENAIDLFPDKLNNN